MHYADNQMLIHICRSYLHHPGINSIKALTTSIERSENERAQAEKALGEREVRVKALSGALKNLETGYNFVGLHKGFSDMRRGKRFQKFFNVILLVLLGVAAVAPFAFKLYQYLALGKADEVSVSVAFSFLGAEILVLYFFRVLLHNFRMIQAQLIQIDLRMTLCQFIQSYADYSKELRGTHPELLVRFEQIVFSGIVNAESSLPTTFDGLDQIAGLLDKIRPKS
jgi:hypothetical protein